MRTDLKPAFLTDSETLNPQPGNTRQKPISLLISLQAASETDIQPHPMAASSSLTDGYTRHSHPLSGWIISDQAELT